MTDPNPLLSHSCESKEPSLDDTIEHCIGEFGWPQIFQATLVCLAWFFDAQQTFISIFTDAQPKWSCTKGTCNTTTTTTNLCQLSKDSWIWDFPPTTSIVSEWSLQCESSIITGLPASAFFFGCLVGGFVLATLADSTLGRKNMLVFSSLLMSLTGIMTAAATNLWIYSAFRFVCGFGRATVGTCALVLGTELVGKKRKENIGILGFLCFTLGFLSLPIIAYLLQGSSWRLIYAWTCIPSLVYSLLVYFLVRESPRWLFIKGRKEEFADTLKSISSPGKRSSLTQSFFGRCSNCGEESPKETDVFSSLKMFVKKGWSLRRLVAAMVVGFGIGMIYYGMPLGLGSLSLDLYLSVTLNAILEFPASIATFFFIRNLNRKGSMIGLTVLSGICSVACVLVSWNGTRIAMELVSFFSACSAFEILLIYTLELFPTSVRNSAVSMVRQAMVLGGVLSPVLVAAGRTNNGVLSYGVFGATVSICGIFVACLPETRGSISCDTMEEEELKYAAITAVHCV